MGWWISEPPQRPGPGTMEEEEDPFLRSCLACDVAKYCKTNLQKWQGGIGNLKKYYCKKNTVLEEGSCWSNQKYFGGRLKLEIQKVRSFYYFERTFSKQLKMDFGCFVWRSQSIQVLLARGFLPSCPSGVWNIGKDQSRRKSCLRSFITLRKLRWQWKIHREWRCISRCKWGFSNVILVFRGVMVYKLGHVQPKL